MSRNMYDYSVWICNINIYKTSVSILLVKHHECFDMPVTWWWPALKAKICWELCNIYWNKAEFTVFNMHSVELLWHKTQWNVILWNYLHPLKKYKIEQTWNMTSYFKSAVTDTFIFKGSIPHSIWQKIKWMEDTK